MSLVVLATGLPMLAVSAPSTPRDDSPRIWSSPLNLSNSLESSRYPAIAVANDGIVHVVWQEYTDEGYMIYHRYLRNGTWSPASPVVFGESPSIAVDGRGYVHLVYADQRFENYDIFYEYWDGTRWVLPSYNNISNSKIGQSQQPSIAISPRDGSLHVVWLEYTNGNYQIQHGSLLPSDTEPQPWQTFPIPNAKGQAPTIAIGSDGRLHVAWAEAPPCDQHCLVDYIESANGRTWAPWASEVSDKSGDARLPWLAVQGNVAHIAWEQDQASGRGVIYHSFGTDFQNAWSDPEPVSDPAIDSRVPRLAVDRSGVSHAAWKEARPQPSILYSRRLTSWMTGQDVFTSTRTLDDPALAFGPNGTLHLAWAEDVGDDNYEIYYSRLTAPIYLPLTLSNKR